jgi:hypothetical protein
MEQVIGMWAAQFRNTCWSPKTELEIPTATLMLSICSSSPTPVRSTHFQLGFSAFGPPEFQQNGRPVESGPGEQAIEPRQCVASSSGFLHQKRNMLLNVSG